MTSGIILCGFNQILFLTGFITEYHFKSHEILMVVINMPNNAVTTQPYCCHCCQLRNNEHCNVTMLDSINCSCFCLGRCARSSFVTSLNCLASFWRNNYIQFFFFQCCSLTSILKVFSIKCVTKI